MTRRRFLAATGMIAAGAAGAAVYARWIEPHWVEVVRRPMPVRHLPSDLVGATVAQLSDIHVGRQVSDAYLIDTFGRVADLRPDIVVITGDFASWHSESKEQFDRVMAQLPHGRRATIGVLGNHDYGHGWVQPDVAKGVVEIVTRHDVKLLRNDVVDVDGLLVGGLDDWWAGRFDADRVIPRLLEGERASIVLSHNPDTADLPVWRDYRGWILSGHTHGGQCRPPFLPPPILPVFNTRYTAGAFDLDGGRKLYINRGLGHLQKVRFNVRPEVTLFELRRDRS